MHHKATFAALAMLPALFLGACGGRMTSPIAASATTSTTPTTTTSLVSSLEITGFTTLSEKGQSGRLSALVTFANGTVQDRTTVAQWASADVTVATINAQGIVTAVSDGHTIVTATFGTVSDTKIIIVDLPVDLR